MFSSAVLVALRVTVLLAAALLCLTLMKNRAASARALLAVLSLAGAVLLPFVSLASPAWEVVKAVPGLAIRAAAITGAPGSSGVSWKQFLLPIWLAGVVAVLARWGIGYWLSIRERRRSEPPQDPGWNHELRALKAERITLGFAAVSSPIACGLLRPAILVPKEAADWDVFRRRVVLMHELAHVQRGDVWANLLAVIASAMFWFHPLVWMVSARLRREQELACDDAVLSAGVPAASYADVLLETARALPSSLLFGCPMATGRGVAGLRQRFAHLLSIRPRGGVSPWLVRSMALALPVALVLVSAVRLLPAEEVYKMGGEVSAPRVVYKVEPQYTQDARDAKLEGTVVLRIVVGSDGLPRDIQVLRSLDAGLDRNAVRAVEQWRFEPATRKGERVAVSANIEVNFHLL